MGIAAAGWVLAAVLSLAALAPAPVAAYADGAPPGFSGGFGEQSCHACHFEAEPNTPPGSLTIEGVPAQAVAGQRYPLTVTLTRPGLVLAGFQLSARFSDGKQAGTLAPGEGEQERVRVETQGGVQYANQRQKGGAPSAPDVARWTVLWTAPDPGAVEFHAAANAANNDERVGGDFVYIATARTR